MKDRRRRVFWIVRKITDWLIREHPERNLPRSDIARLGYEARPGDVVLVEGTSRVSDVIKLITQSNWTHSALYIGRLYDIEDPELRDMVTQHYDGDPEDQLLLEALLGSGTIIVPLTKYKKFHLRLCRPNGLAPKDASAVIAHAVRQLGKDYDIRHLLDLARFLYPWTIMPRRWRSSLFEASADDTTRTVCSCLIAEAFHKVQFPILPFVGRDEHGELRLVKRNPRLYTPKDFDYSPYFDIIKYPYLGTQDIGLYKYLPWNQDDVYFNDDAKQLKAILAESANVQPVADVRHKEQ
ncbi:MAG TPA: hypothetical protein EYN73_01875 [Chromatiaceae bacterium]|jgi:hypothetical protein|nr:hypothetical protein [Chromatiaceae bacterium]HIB84352.1 hypothetical protein [Chromatiaceae bacterium]HIN81391.1 hypothetical protein [Chromatiales bacterium]HIO13818.1 hypothetical protein [Chromatiales bacterium]HIO54132.1 hypothetical protein [Chromatiales bacterium]